MKIIGLTGGIGSGKTTVLKLFKELGADVYIADIEAKKLMNEDEELIEQLKKMFGAQTYINKNLNNSYIASVVFNNKEKLIDLNKLVHPKVKAHFNKFIKNSSKEIVIYESAILFESKSDKMCDLIITVTANVKDRIDRIRKRDNVSEKQVLDRVKNQLNDDYRIKHSDFIIENNTLENTKSQVFDIYKLITEQSKN